jgi:hypothetical protein
MAAITGFSKSFLESYVLSPGCFRKAGFLAVRRLQNIFAAPVQL